MSESEPVDDVRLLIADEDETNQLLTDAKLEQLLELEGGNVKLAAAQALDIIASSEVLVSKVIKTQDLSTDGTKVAADLRSHATRLREQHEDGDGYYFDVVDLDDCTGPELTSGWS